MSRTGEVAPARELVLDQLVQVLVSRRAGHPLRVGVDGVCGAGKSTFARALAGRLEADRFPVVFVDSDGFHHVRARRYRQGPESARGYYQDAYDFDSLAERVLVPLGPGGSLRYAVTVHDLVSDEVIADATAVAPIAAIMLFDATFIQNERLDGLWDQVIYLHADEAAAIQRGVARDSAALGGAGPARQAYQERYMAACRIYLLERDPARRASFVVDNTNPAHPVLVRS